MGFFDSLLGRSRPAVANLDVLFSVPQAALTLQTNGYVFAGSGAVCYRPNEGAAFAATETDAKALLNADDGPAVERVDDGFGFRWLTLSHQPDDVSGMVTDLHAVNSSLTDAGFGQSLLCSTVNFTTADNKPFAIVYLYKRGTFYPFAPLPGDKRDNALELQLRGIVADDIPIEADLSRWLAIWGAPGL
ncbi:MAG: hypothetical protein M3Q98_01460 [Actinomycetota bacterium]|nr:hypothetical protein [Actinomycetota bacterium]